MTMDRKTNPQIQEIEKATIIPASKCTLKNGIPVYHINAGTQDLVKIELLFPAGLWQQPAPLVAMAANAMMQEGTSKHSAKEIAERIDFYGAFLETSVAHDFSGVSIYSMNRHLANVLPVVSEIINDAAFCQNEWDIYLQNKKQSFIVNNNKLSFISRKKFAELLFGNHHPYGYNISDKDFDALKKEDAYSFYQKSYCAKGMMVIASGKVTDTTLQLIEKYFGNLQFSSDVVHYTGSKKALPTIGMHHIEKEKALQSVIRMGKLLFTKTHPDYPAMLVLNTVFGGYFGSRLMANIREDKGYTYGIGSSMTSYKQEGYFSIATEVGAEVTTNALKEIYFELNKIQTKKISESELQLVRNYMLGSFLRSMDGPFALADRFKGIYFNGLDYEYYDRYVEAICSVTAEKLMELANKYWNKEDMIELVVGRK